MTEVWDSSMSPIQLKVDSFFISFPVYMKGHMVVLGTALGTLMVPGYWSLQMG